ncbi:MinD superfamily P-loop ATPase, contains an inserted ferredoxin domain [Desulfurobacterium pacificum]|uniref:MinD superfamily P-loop ATPase, contains an inserted ferredoxin domain n=1 Tax=Desulfurobacterium pacificum TaxID=240166 RepID=A0ABY1NCC0_9BACT|nr:ATP-binding protein [Desulfurobacterium pacificum]SMP06269.1 MinD superfamily P-loop ATPase, contains an inserted ferredoxin domain [Desulfurobacterium pacificum]
MIISISGGKGGTGKSTLSTNLSILLQQFTLVDLDVEAPNDHILLNVKLTNGIPVKLFKPKFNHSYCTSCGICASVCNDNAIILNKERKPILLKDLCGGCTACKLACPSEKAIEEEHEIIGYIYENETSYGFKLITGTLLEGKEKTYKVLLETKRRATKEEKVILDTAAGAGNSIFKALEGSDIVIAVTEPTPFGARDLEKILHVTSYLKLKTVIVINKSGLGNEKEIINLSEKYNYPIIGRIPYSENIIKCYFDRTPIVKTQLPEAKIFEEIKEKIMEELKCN